MQESNNHKLITKVLTKVIYAHEFTAFKEKYPKSHVGSFPQLHHSLPMKWIMVYTEEETITI